jgi:hypothetical protein
MSEEKYMEFMCVGCSEICLARLRDIPKLCLLKGANTYDLRVNWIRIDNLEPIDIAREIINLKYFEYR